MIINEVYEVEICPNTMMKVGVEFIQEHLDSPKEIKMSYEDFVRIMTSASENGEFKRIASVYDIEPNDNEDEFNAEMDRVEEEIARLLA